ncbi:MAG: hypothetical protein KJ067_24660 [Vicinamibacteria bacterium]|jgi:hypothetical protein|nr:hypothetical protein [Vicinamibacteria bacterium]
MRPGIPSASQGAQRRSSLRARLRKSIFAVVVVTLGAFTGAAIVEERRLSEESASLHATLLLAHLAHMPEFAPETRSGDARASLSHSLFGATVSRVDLLAAGDSRSSAWPVVARRPVRLADGMFELQYRVDPAHTQHAVWRTVAIHAAHALAALVALLGATEWILRRNLVVPLRALAHQIELIRDGRGWDPHLPPSDAEIGEVATSLEQLGPSLERQVHEWIEAERRSAAASVLARLRSSLSQKAGPGQEEFTSVIDAEAARCFAPLSEGGRP